METQETFILRKDNLQETPVPNKMSCEKAHLIPGDKKLHINNSMIHGAKRTPTQPRFHHSTCTHRHILPHIKGLT